MLEVAWLIENWLLHSTSLALIPSPSVTEEKEARFLNSVLVTELDLRKATSLIWLFIPISIQIALLLHSESDLLAITELILN